MDKSLDGILRPRNISQDIDELIRARRQQMHPMSDNHCKWCGALLPLVLEDYHQRCREIRERIKNA